MPRRAGREQHLLRAQRRRARMRCDSAPPSFSIDVTAACSIEPRAVARGRVREADGELAHVHLAAVLLQQAAVKAVRLHLAANPVAADQFDVGIDFAPDQLGGLFEMFEVMRLRGELELARSEIVAVDLLRRGSDARPCRPPPHTRGNSRARARRRVARRAPT